MCSARLCIEHCSLQGGEQTFLYIQTIKLITFPLGNLYYLPSNRIYSFMTFFMTVYIPVRRTTCKLKVNLVFSEDS